MELNGDMALLLDRVEDLLNSRLSEHEKIEQQEKRNIERALKALHSRLGDVEAGTKRCDEGLRSSAEKLIILTASHKELAVLTAKIQTSLITAGRIAE